MRADLGVVAGSEVGIHYDSMLGKIIAHAPTRRDAARILKRALDETWVPGLVTNRELLARILAHPAFVAGELDTHFLDHHAGELAAKPPGLDRLRVAAIAATLHGIHARRPAEPLAPAGWRNVRAYDQVVTYEGGIQIGYRPDGAAIVFAIGGKDMRVDRFGLDGDTLWWVESPGLAGARGETVEHGAHRRSARVAVSGTRTWVLADGALTLLVEEPRFPEAHARAVEGALVAPMPGKVVKVLASVGQEVAAGAPLVVLEAMKMEHTVRAQAAGTVRTLHVAVGDQVDGDHLLAVVT